MNSSQVEDAEWEKGRKMVVSMQSTSAIALLPDGSAAANQRNGKVLGMSSYRGQVSFLEDQQGRLKRRTITTSIIAAFKDALQLVGLN